MTRWCLTLLCLLVSPVPSVAAEGGVTLTVKVTGFRNAAGQLIVALYDSGDTWLKPERAVKLVKIDLTSSPPSADKSVETKLDGVRPGTYAVGIIHDENRNGKLDMKWFPLPHPAEGGGATNDPVAKIGPPSYGDSKIVVGAADQGVTIKLFY